MRKKGKVQGNNLKWSELFLQQSTQKAMRENCSFITNFHTALLQHLQAITRYCSWKTRTCVPSCHLESHLYHLLKSQPCIASSNSHSCWLGNLCLVDYNLVLVSHVLITHHLTLACTTCWQESASTVKYCQVSSQKRRLSQACQTLLPQEAILLYTVLPAGGTHSEAHHGLDSICSAHCQNLQQSCSVKTRHKQGRT